MFLAGHPSQGCFGLQSRCAPCYFFNQASFHPSDFSFMSINVALFSYTRALGDGPRHFEPWSRDKDDTRAAPLLTTTPHQREDVSALDRFHVHRSPTRWVFSGTGLELETYLP
ncbi:hypothetical protein TNCV_608661 [Trichonephila clavipes]|nr:hypothetical protein TNCV_608661 [Trichonephila clavipes]